MSLRDPRCTSLRTNNWKCCPPYHNCEVRCWFLFFGSYTLIVLSSLQDLYRDYLEEYADLLFLLPSIRILKKIYEHFYFRSHHSCVFWFSLNLCRDYDGWTYTICCCRRVCSTIFLNFFLFYNFYAAWSVKILWFFRQKMFDSRLTLSKRWW